MVDRLVGEEETSESVQSDVPRTSLSRDDLMRLIKKLDGVEGHQERVAAMRTELGRS